MNEKIKSPSGQGAGGGSGGAGAGGGSGSGGTTGVATGGNIGPPSMPPSPAANTGGGPGGGGPPPPQPPNTGSESQVPPHHYGPPVGGDPSLSHYHPMHQQPPHGGQHLPPHQQQPGGLPPAQAQNPGEHPNKDEYSGGPMGVSGPPPPPPGGHHPVYGRYHHGDPGMDPYRPYAHAMQQPAPGGKPQQQTPPPAGPGGIASPSRPPPQRYIPGQPPQGPTPTLNSLLQSSHPPPPPQHRYSSNYDPQQQQQQQQQQGVPNAPQQTQGPGAGPPPGPHGPPPPPPPHQSPYGTQQGWAPPPRPYSPQMGPSQVYRTPPPQTSSRGQPPYPQQTAPHGQNSGSYPSSPQQQQQLGAGGPPPPLSAPPPSATNQNATGSGPTSGAPPPPNSQYAPYPQRYPTPPGPPPGSGVAPNHRTPYSAHQYPDPNRPWPSGGTSPAPSPGPHQSGGHPPLPPHPPASPHQSHPGHHGPPGGVPGNVAQPPPPSSTSPGHAPSPSPQPSQASPSPHQELIGQNSNDSSSGGAHSGMGSGPPGTPNPQQMMRPTPSPTGSSGSRSMSPAVAQNHPISRPSSNQSSSGGPMQQPGPPTQQSQQCPSSGGGQQQAPPNQTVNSMPTPPPPGAPGAYPPPPHMHGAYKMPGGQSPLPAGYGPPPQQQQYQQGQYPPRPQYAQGGYAPAPPPNQQPPANNMLPGAGQQYAGRPLPNHTGNNPHAQYPPYQNWVPPAPQTAPTGAVGAAGGAGNTAMGNHVQGKATPPPGGAPPPQGSASPRPLNYLKQHLQHKGGYTGSGSMPPQGYGNGPAGMHPGMPMGPPPHHMGPPHGPTSMGPPASTPPQSMMSGPVGGPSGIEAAAGSGIPEHISQDNGISSSGSSSTSAPHAVTSVVTTGPDGAPMDEVSQQSTLSNASAASAEDPQCTTPKRKNDPYSQSHLAPPSTSPSGHAPPTGPHPGGAGEEYDMNSPPNWTRTPASPQVFNSHVANQDSFRSNKKSDSLCKLYEMDDSPDRRVWLDKLRTFMEDRRTPITACPTISKQPLDLYRLYIYVKDRGGFVEVTKSKTWKDIAGLLGIGASSSAAYTLRKHYTKNLLAFECHFDRGDCDPGPIIQQAEAGTKKKTTKAASVPSPAGSSNSQDSFPVPPGQTANPAIDGYPGYPGSAAYPGAGPQPEYAAPGQIQRPPSQSNAQTPHAGPPYPGQPGAYGQYGSADQYNASGPPGQFGQNQAQFPIQNRSMYPPYGAEGEAPPPGSNQYGPYGNRPYSQPPPGGAQTPAPPGGPTAAGPPAGGPNAPGGAYPSGAPTPQDYYRPPDQSPQPRRHPDFVKDTQSTYGYNTRPQLYGGWQAGSQPYRSQYPPSPAPQGWGGAPPRTAAPPGAALGPPNQQAPPSAQWELRYPPQQGPPPPPQQQQPYQQTQPQGQPPPPPPQWGQMGACGQPPQPGSPGSPLRPPNNQQQQRLPNTVGPPGMAGPQQPPGMPGQPGAPPPGSLNKSSYAMPPPQSLGNSGGPPCGPPGSQLGPPPGMSVGGMPKPPSQMMSQQQMPQQLHQHQQAYVQQQGGQLVKKELIFPADSVEATTPVMYRRKRLTKADVCPVDPWRIFMAMRSGLLAECTWALDVLNVLLFDDTTVQYFGLAHLPGLLTLLLEHFQKHLAEMFSDNDTHTQSHRLCAVDMKNGEKHTRMRTYCSYNRKRQLQQQEQKNNKLLNGDKNDDDASVKSEEKIVEEELDLGQIRDIPKAEERVLLLSHTPNYTMVSRKGLSVRLQAATEDIFVIDNQKNWDVENTRAYEEQVLPSGASTWTFGFGSERDPNDGIIDVFKSEFIDIPFARFIRSNKNKHKMNNINNNNNNNNTSNNNKNNKSKDVEIKVEPMESGTSVSDSTDEDTRLSFGGSKKRRIYNNSNNNNNNTAKSINADGVLTKKSKLQNEEEGVFVQPSEIKKEVIEKTASTNATTANDSDCREVDMEIERSNDKPQDDTTTTTTPATEDETEKETVFDPIKTIRDPALILQRRRDSSYEDECYTRDEASLYLVNESQDALARRCINISNIFRNLSFVPGNEIILARSARFLAILGRLLLLNHEHLQRTPKTRNYDREEDTDFSDSCSSLQGEREWWWEYLIHIRENMLVALTNIAGHLELSRYEEIVARPLIDGLLHWAVCPSAHGQDPFPSCGPNSLLSPQRLALEALCKLCVTDANVDLVIATPPFARLEKLCAVLTRHLCRNEDQVLREFSVNLLHYLAAADSAMARTVALQSPCISYLVAFIEQAESTALGVANQHGINYLRENPDAMGTSLDMLRRAAGTLLHLARHADNRSLFMQQEQRLLGLVMSHILDQQVALIISRVLFQVSRGAAPLPSLEYRNQQRQQNDTHDKKSPANTQAVASNVEEKTVKTDKNAKELKTEKTQEGDNAKNAEKRSSTETAAAVNSTEEHEKSNSNLVDENSNSSNQLPPNAILNDVSNSSTNSNSCSTAASVLSNNSSSLGAHLNNNVAGNASATTGAASAVAATDIQMTEQITPQQQQQQQPQQQQQQQQIPQCKSILGGNNTTVPVVNCNSNSNSSSNCNNNNNNNISLNNGNSRSSNSSNSSSGSGSGTNSITNTAAAQAAAAAAAVAAAASASAQPSTAAPTAAASNTTAAVA